MLGGQFFDEESDRVVTYRVTRLPAALLASFAAGNVSSLLGLGGGILKVPALNTWCGVPVRAAAATSAFMIGVTAAGGPSFITDGGTCPRSSPPPPYSACNSGRGPAFAWRAASRPSGSKCC